MRGALWWAGLIALLLTKTSLFSSGMSSNSFTPGCLHSRAGAFIVVVGISRVACVVLVLGGYQWVVGRFLLRLLAPGLSPGVGVNILLG
jgi:hypothetical protein